MFSDCILVLKDCNVRKSQVLSYYVAKIVFSILVRTWPLMRYSKQQNLGSPSLRLERLLTRYPLLKFWPFSPGCSLFTAPPLRSRQQRMRPAESDHKHSASKAVGKWPVSSVQVKRNIFRAGVEAYSPRFTPYLKEPLRPAMPPLSVSKRLGLPFMLNLYLEASIINAFGWRGAQPRTRAEPVGAYQQKQ